jgi:hypothetical protein
MSDAGRYAAMEDEIATALENASLPGEPSVRRTMDIETLAAREGIRKPAIGISLADSHPTAPPMIGGKSMASIVSWEISVITQSGRGAVDSRPLLYSILEAVLDTLNGMVSTQPACRKYRWAGEKIIMMTSTMPAAAIATYQIETIKGL